MKLCVILALCCIAPALGDWMTQPPFYGQRYAGGGGARALLIDPSGDLLALLRSSNGIEVYYEEENPDGTINVVQKQIVNANGLNLNHGLTYNNGYLYASSSTTVYRWAFTPGNHDQITTQPQMVIENMPNGGHDTRTLIFDTEGRLYVSVGSNGNVDRNSDRARIRRFNLGGLLPIPFNTGEVFADGLRNEVGLAWNNNGVLYGVENGVDQLNRGDLGGDIHNTNPSEEMNRFDKPAGQHYGYPWCFSTKTLQDYEPGTQFAHPDFMNDGTHNDNWCKNVANNQPPAISMGAHQAPLGIDFFRGQSCGMGGGAFPCNMTDNAIVAFHGSWNSDIKVGYKVTMFGFDGETPTGEEWDVIADENIPNCNNCFRPVNAVWNNKGHLFVSSDSQGVITRVTYGQPAPTIRANIEY